MSYIPSVHQEKAYKLLKETNSNICIASTAGSGKTSTILDMLKLVPKFSRCIFLSFSNTIVNELKSRVPIGVTASTLHSLGSGFCYQGFSGIQFNEDKYFIKALTLFYPDKKDRTNKTYRECYQIQDICNFVRMTMTSIDSEKEVRDMCDYYSLDWQPEQITRAIVLLNSKNTKVMDFTDMIYLPVQNPQVITKKYDYVFLDEAQDLNNCQYQFVEKLLTPKGRLISVGDSYQSIYSFAGASIDSFEKLQQRPNTITVSLPVSYRCPKSVVERAKSVCESIQHYEHSEEGIVRRGSIEEAVGGDIILSRYTKPLIITYLQLLDKGIKSTIVGKDIEYGLMSLSDRCKSSTMEGYERNFKQELFQTRNELLSKNITQPNKHQTYIKLEEKISVLTFLLKRVDTPSSLPKYIKELFKGSKDSVVLMTLHKSKGLESKRVFLIEKFDGEKLLPSKYAVKEHELIQERNLEFVGLTRSKNELVFCDVTT